MILIKKVALALIFIFLFVSQVSAQNEPAGQERVGQPIYEGKIIKVLEEKNIEVGGQKQLYQKLEIRVTKGEGIGNTRILENGDLPIINLIRYRSGDDIKFTKTTTVDGRDIYYILDYVRRNTVYRLFLIFILFVVAVAKWRGITSIAGMFISYSVIFLYILPQIIKGNDPVTVTIIGSLMIIPATFYLSHGFNGKTTAAILGTVISLVFTGILTTVFVSAAKLSGLSSEESGFLQLYMQGNLDIKGLLYAGILIGALGVMDDITISQASIVEQLKKTNPKIEGRELYNRAMVVGQDHIASMVNTLVLVYTGAALPLLLLFLKTNNTVEQIIDFEIVTEEIIRTLVGSIGLIFAVPLTTMITALMLGRRKQV